MRIHIMVPSGARRLAINIWERFGAHFKQMKETRPTAGTRTIEWDGTDNNGKVVCPGSFIIRVTTDRQSESRIVQVLT